MRFYGDKKKGNYFSGECAVAISLGPYIFWDKVSNVVFFWRDIRVAQTKSGEAQLCPLAQFGGKWCFWKGRAALQPGFLEVVILFRLFP